MNVYIVLKHREGCGGEVVLVTRSEASAQNRRDDGEAALPLRRFPDTWYTVEEAEVEE